MFKTLIVVSALVALTQAGSPVLRVSPVVIGSSQPGQVQVIQLAAGGGLGTGVPVVSSQFGSASSFQPSTYTVQAAPAQAQQAVHQQVQTASVRPVTLVASQPRAVSADYSNSQSVAFQSAPVTLVASQPRAISADYSNSQSVAFQSAPVTSVSFESAPVVSSTNVAYQSSVQAVPSVAFQSAPSVSASTYQASPRFANYQSESSSVYSAESQEVPPKPSPFAFAFDSEDEFGTKIGRQESGNEQGVVTGSYSLSDANGVARIVNYIADAQGFRAQVQTNEPGTITSQPAGVQITSSAQPPAPAARR